MDRQINKVYVKIDYKMCLNICGHLTKLVSVSFNTTGGFTDKPE